MFWRNHQGEEIHLRYCTVFAEENPRIGRPTPHTVQGSAVCIHIFYRLSILKAALWSVWICVWLMIDVEIKDRALFVNFREVSHIFLAKKNCYQVKVFKYFMNCMSTSFLGSRYFNNSLNRKFRCLYVDCIINYVEGVFLSYEVEEKAVIQVVGVFVNTRFYVNRKLF